MDYHFLSVGTWRVARRTLSILLNRAPKLTHRYATASTPPPSNSSCYKLWPGLTFHAWCRDLLCCMDKAADPPLPQLGPIQH